MHQMTPSLITISIGMERLRAGTSASCPFVGYPYDFRAQGYGAHLADER